MMDEGRCSPGGRRKSRNHGAILMFAAGSVVALAGAELCLRQVASPYGGFKNAAGRETRVYDEGMVRSHFDRMGLRVTGGDEIAGGRVGLIVGDSHVEASQVEDGQTMAARAEVILRRGGERVNVRSYGESGADLGALLVAARRGASLLRPDWIVIVASPNDIRREGMLRFSRESFREPVVGETIAGPRTGARGMRRRLSLVAQNSVLVWTLVKRGKQLRTAWLSKSGATVGPATRSSGEALSAMDEAFRTLRGQVRAELVLAFDPGKKQAEDVGQTRAVMELCERRGFNFVNLGPVLRQGRSRGFMNTAPGVGHYNAAGHERIARALVPVLLGARVRGTR